MKKYISIGKIKKDILRPYEEKIVTDKVILTYERLYNHILVYHVIEYEQIKKYIKNIIEEPDIVLEDNSHLDTLIFLKHILEINKKARVVVKLATDKNHERYTKNSIITLMRQRNKSWEQTIKNKGKIIYSKTRQNWINIV